MADVVRTHASYINMGGEERSLVNDICKEIEKQKDPIYYYEKLILLLDTPYETNKSKLATAQKNDLRKSVATVKQTKRTDTSSEEQREQELEGWIKYRPNSSSPYFYIHRCDPMNIFIRIHVKLVGDTEIVEQMYRLEDAVEKHLHVPGFYVNLVWADYEGDDVFVVHTDPGEWATSYNWAGDYEVISHELMHLFGLDDEYDRIESHAGNKHLPTKIRLQWFLVQMRDTMFDDAETGIMWHNWKKPLPRHVCWAVGLGDDCIEARINAYGATP